MGKQEGKGEGRTALKEVHPECETVITEEEGV
jgi:hypothetical protein